MGGETRILFLCLLPSGSCLRARVPTCLQQRETAQGRVGEREGGRKGGSW